MGGFPLIHNSLNFMLTMAMQRGDEKGRKLDNWIFAAIFILGIIISPWHQLGLGDNAACNCLCLLNAKDKNESEICNTLHWILRTFIISFISYWAIISPHSPVPSQRTHPHKQVCIAAENICSLYLRRSISRLWDQSSWLIKCSSCVNIHECLKHVLREANNVFRLSMNRWGFVWSMLQIQSARKWFPSNNLGILLVLVICDQKMLSAFYLQNYSVASQEKSE